MLASMMSMGLSGIQGYPVTVEAYNADGMPIGMQFVSDHWNEDVLLTMAEEWDKQEQQQEYIYTLLFGKVIHIVEA